MRKFLLGSSILIFSGILLGQAVSYIPVWSNNHYTFPTLGKSFVIQNGVLDVLISPTRVRIYGLRLLYNTSTQGYTLPPSISNIVVFHNGLRNFEVIDYTCEGNNLKMLYANPESVINIDYDEAK